LQLRDTPNHQRKNGKVVEINEEGQVVTDPGSILAVTNCNNKKNSSAESLL